MVAAVMTVCHARRRQKERHLQWALRFFVLAIASWLYRLHYVVWHATTGGLASEKDFSGFFDQIQNFAFFVPYLIALEIYFRSRRQLAGGQFSVGDNIVRRRAGKLQKTSKGKAVRKSNTVSGTIVINGAGYGSFLCVSQGLS